MLSPDEARAKILGSIAAPSDDAIERVPLADAGGRCLAVAVESDVDIPPFEKSMMDGFAVRSSDFVDVPSDAMPVTLRCVGESRAGAPFAGGETNGKVLPGTCIEIYTGAAVPDDCDAVEMIERTSREGEAITFDRSVPRGQHVSHRAEILGTGRAALTPPRRLSPADLSVLAAVGADPVPVRPRVRVSILTTGDELVPARETPSTGQIREGNTLYLAEVCRREGCDVRRVGIVPDDAEVLVREFREALEDGDVLITTGGVSMGKYDLVGAAFEAIGVEPVLHKVAIKPGKPIWFGMRGAKPVFGLPGNPLSSLLGFEVFVRPALARLAGAGEDEQAERLLRGRWSGGELRASDRQHNVPVVLRAASDGVVELHPIVFRGSADIVSAAEADGLAVVPANGTIHPGEVIDFRPLSRALRT